MEKQSEETEKKRQRGKERGTGKKGRGRWGERESRGIDRREKHRWRDRG